MRTLPSRVLITGADGFTGQYLVQALEREGVETLRGVRSPVAAKDVACDLEDAAGLQRLIAEHSPDAIVHLAAISFAAHEDTAQIYRTNVLGTLNLLNAIDKAEVRLSHLILASSAAVYGAQEVSELHEALTPQPRSDYGISKLASEHLALTRSSARNLAIVRPFNYTGAGQAESFLIPKLVSHFVDKAPLIELGNLNVAREFNDVRWAVTGYGQLLGMEFGTQTLNLCTGRTYTLQAVLDQLAEITGHTPKIGVNEAFVRPNDPPLICGSPHHARELGLSPPDQNAENSLRALLAWMCEDYANRA